MLKEQTACIFAAQRCKTTQAHVPDNRQTAVQLATAHLPVSCWTLPQPRDSRNCRGETLGGVGDMSDYNAGVACVHGRQLSCPCLVWCVLQLDAVSAVDAEQRFRKASGKLWSEATFPEYSPNLAKCSREARKTQH